MAAETVRVIGTAMTEAGVIGMGRLTMSRRERMVMVARSDLGLELSRSRWRGRVTAYGATSLLPTTAGNDRNPP